MIYGKVILVKGDQRTVVLSIKSASSCYREMGKPAILKPAKQEASKDE